MAGEQPCCQAIVLASKFFKDVLEPKPLPWGHLEWRPQGWMRHVLSNHKLSSSGGMLCCILDHVAVIVLLLECWNQSWAAFTCTVLFRSYILRRSGSCFHDMVMVLTGSQPCTLLLGGCLGSQSPACGWDLRARVAESPVPPHQGIALALTPHPG